MGCNLNGFREHITKSKRNLENMIYGASSKKHMTYKDYNKFWDVIDRLRDMQDSSYIFMTETNITEEILCEMETCFFGDKKCFKSI